MNKDFVTITNKEIFNRLNNLEKNNEIAHDKILKSIAGYNSNLKRLQWAIGGLSGLLTITLISLVNHIGG